MRKLNPDHEFNRLRFLTEKLVEFPEQSLKALRTEWERLGNKTSISPDDFKRCRANSLSWISGTVIGFGYMGDTKRLKQALERRNARESRKAEERAFLERFPVGSEIIGATFTKSYDAYFAHVLVDRISPVLREKGRQKRWKVTSSLPSKAEYADMKQRVFTKPAGELLKGVTDDCEELRSELEDWYENLPEGFKESYKGEALQEAINILFEIVFDSIPELVAATNFFHLPSLDASSRMDRASDAAATLRDVSVHLRERLVPTLNLLADNGAC